MPQGDKSKYSSKQKRMAEHIEKGYKKKGASSKKAERIAWATVNKETGGAGKRVKNKAPARRAGKMGGSKKSKSRSSHTRHAHAA